MLYPKIEPFDHFMLPVSELHHIYVEQCGRPDGIPVLYIHGGPGAGCCEHSRRFFNPDKYRAILVDQRGCGRSRPSGEMQENNIHHLIADFEQIRQKLNIDQWLLFGGSWGSTLSLAYAQAFPQNISGLILRGIFLGRSNEIDWLFKVGGIQRFHPELWQYFCEIIPAAERDDLLSAYHKRLFCDDAATRKVAAERWCKVEFDMSSLLPAPNSLDEMTDVGMYEMAAAECHYMINGLFLTEHQLIGNVDKIHHLPAAIVHGRYDMICNFENAWVLKQAWPKASLHIVDDGGHSAHDPAMETQLVKVADRFAHQLRQ